MLVLRAPNLLRRMDSNHRPTGYEPAELPLLYATIYGGDDETRTRVLQRTNNTSISHG